MFPPKIGVIGPLFIVAVFNPAPGVVQSPQAGIDTDKTLSPDEVAQFYIFICAHLIAFNLVPGEIEPRGSLVFGADPILPIVAGHKIPTGPSDDGNLELLYE